MSLLPAIDLKSLPEISASRLSVNQAEALRYLQHPGEPSPKLAQELTQAAAAVLAAAAPRYTLQAFAISGRQPIQLSGAALQLPGSAIAALLQDTEVCLLFAATLGAQADELIRRAQIRDVAQTLLLDACASCAIESLCDQAQEQIRERCAAAGYYLTQRFSPGYGDLPLELQKPLCAALDTARRIGLTVSQSGLLLPRKSVTAIMGISPRPQAAPQHSCAACNMASRCPYRKAGQTCQQN